VTPKPCPFTPSRLHEMYWREGLSLDAIRKAASALAGEAVGQTAVTRWLRINGIALRTHSEASAVRIAKAPEVYRNRARQMREAWQAKYEAGEMPPPVVKTISAKARRAAIKATKGRTMETRACSLPGCIKTITRPAGQFRRENAYCCREHMGIGINKQRKDDQEYQAWLKTQSE